MSKPAAVTYGTSEHASARLALFYHFSPRYAGQRQSDLPCSEDDS